MKDRRLEGRCLCADLVQVEWHSSNDRSCVEKAVLEDISGMGASLQTEVAVPVGIDVTITMGEARFTGLVTYCTYRDYGYFSGVRFAEASHWSRKIFCPEHLTNLEALALGITESGETPN